MAFNNAVNTIWLNNPASTDAFSRFRVSNPTTIFDAQFTYNLQPLLFEQITSGTGATISHDATNRDAVLSFSSTPSGGAAYMQSYQYHRYQPSKSQLVFVTFNFNSQVANCLKFAGYSDGVNGFEFQNNGSTNQFVIYSSSSNGNQTVTQSNWNLDKLDGSGDSGILLDITKTQIMVLDFQALYVGRVRVGFDIDGDIVYCHEFLHANLASFPYIATANLPIRVGMTCSGTVTTTMNFICCAVSSEGGRDKEPNYSFAQDFSVAANNGTDTFGFALRPRTTFNGITNRIKFGMISLDMVVTNNTPAYWKLCIGQALTGTAYTNANTTYSGFEYTTTATLSGTPAIVIDSGFASSSKYATGAIPTFRYPITLNAAGAVRDLGTLCLLFQGVAGNSNLNAQITWSEER